MRIGRIGPFSRQAQARKVWSLRHIWNAAHAVPTWLRVSVSIGGKFCCCFAAIELPLKFRLPQVT